MNELDSASSSVIPVRVLSTITVAWQFNKRMKTRRSEKNFAFLKAARILFSQTKKKVEKEIFQNYFSAEEEKKLEESNGTQMDLQRNAIKKTLTLTLEGNFTAKMINFCGFLGTLIRNLFNLEIWSAVTPQSKHVH